MLLSELNKKLYIPASMASITWPQPTLIILSTFNILICNLDFKLDYFSPSTTPVLSCSVALVMLFLPVEHPSKAPSHHWASSSTTKVTFMLLSSFVKTINLFFILSTNYKISIPFNFHSMLFVSLKSTYLVLHLTMVNSLFLSLIGYLLCVSHCE